MEVADGAGSLLEHGEYPSFSTSPAIAKLQGPNSSQSQPKGAGDRHKLSRTPLPLAPALRPSGGPVTGTVASNDLAAANRLFLYSIKSLNLVFK